MNVNIFKFINSNSYGIFAAFKMLSSKPLKINLLLNGIVIDTIETTKNNHLFDITKCGSYHVELFIEYDNSKKIISNKILITSIDKFKFLNRHRRTSNSIKCKTTNQKFDGVDSYFLEIKVLKKFADKVKEKVKIPLKHVSFDLSNINKRSSLHNYYYFRYNQESRYEQLLELASYIENLEYVDYCCE